MKRINDDAIQFDKPHDSQTRRTHNCNTLTHKKAAHLLNNVHQQK